jgi:hypothetical protein
LVGAAGLLAVALSTTTLAKPLPSPLHGVRGAPVAMASPTPVERAAVVIVLDGARWQDVLLGVDGTLAREAGLDPRVANAPTMPRLAALARTRGAVLGAPGRGEAIRASGPSYVSLPGYTEIMTGRPPRACSSNQCPATTIPTIADLVRIDSGTPRESAIFASWPDLVRVASAQPDTLVVSAGRSLRRHEGVLREDPVASQWLDRGARARSFPGEGDYRPDRFTAPLAVRYLESERPRFLFVSLGDADEYGHLGDYASYLGALREADEAIAAVVDVLDRMGEQGQRTTVFVTADHGRAFDFRDHGGAWPESSQVWLVAIGAGVTARGAVAARTERHLADLAPTLREWLRLPADDSVEAGRPLSELMTP